MKQKSEAYDKFIHYKNFVENQTNHKIKILRSDREVSIYLMNLKLFVLKQELNKNIQQPIHHNKMVYPKERIEH